MKRTIIAFAALLSLAAVSSCVKEEGLAVSSVKSSIVFEGGYDMTKIAFGQAEQGVYNLTWTKGDAIGIFSVEQAETFNDNIKAILADGSEGMAKGIFLPIDEVTVIPPVEQGGDPTEIVESLEFPSEENETFFIYYPFRSDAQIDENGRLVSRLDAVQSQKALGDKLLAVNGLSTAFATVSPKEKKATFTLKHELAYICFKASSSSLSGYQLHSVELVDMKHEAQLSGKFAFDIIKKEISVVPDASAFSAAVKVEAHDFASNPTESEVYLTVLPGDYSGADMYAVVSFVNAKGESVTVPKKIEKTCKFPAATLTTIDLGNIDASVNPYAWYEPRETRDLLGRYAYGHTNTYLVEHLPRPEDVKTVTASAVEIDVKARGDFGRVQQPKYYGLEIPCEMGDPGIAPKGRKLLSLDGTNAADAIRRGVYLEIPANFKITVYVLDKTAGTGRWGSVGIYDEDHNVLWSYLISTYEEGQAPKDVAYPGGIHMMDRYLGQIISNEKAASLGTFDTTGGPVLPSFQWGRKDPFPWTNTDGLAFLSAVVCDETTTIEDAIKNPTTMFGYKNTSGTDTHGNWQQENNAGDLWGGYNNTEEWYDPDEHGHKTIFDPCPDGYRVPDAKVFKYLTDACEIWETPNAHSLQIPEGTEGCLINPRSPFYKSTAKDGYTVLAYPLGEGQYDYWWWAGYIGPGGDNYVNNRTANNKCFALETWANCMSGADNPTFGRASCLEYGYWSSAKNFNSRHSSQKAYRYPVRCQKED